MPIVIFVAAAVDTNTGSPLQGRNPNDSRILGSDTFAAKLLGNAWRPRSDKTLDNLIDDACRRFSITHEALASLSRQRQVTHARAWIAHQSLTLPVASLSQVAGRFNRDESSLRESVKRHFSYP